MSVALPVAHTHLGTFQGFNYRSPEPAVSLMQALCAGLAMAAFAVAVAMWCA